MPLAVELGYDEPSAIPAITARAPYAAAQTSQVRRRARSPASC